jgi:hypothetical protein
MAHHIQQVDNTTIYTQCGNFENFGSMCRVMERIVATKKSRRL